MGSFINRVDHIYGKLLVLDLYSKSSRQGNKKTMWVCKCICGDISNYSASNLETGNSTCCLKCRAEKQVIHSCARNGSISAEYISWQHMIQRCYNESNDAYKHYGGRGISVSERWRNSFQNFLLDMGERPEGMTLDRIDVNGNYESSNCRWATKSEQSLNRRKSEFCGVYLRKDTGKWSAYINTNNIRYNLGCFDTQEEALEARINFENKLEEEKYD